MLSKVTTTVAVACLASTAVAQASSPAACAKDKNVQCTYPYTLDSDFTCDELASDWGIPNFQALNPCVDCSKELKAGQTYCVQGTVTEPTTLVTSTTGSHATTSSDPYSPHQTGITSECTNWYKAQKGDSCYNIAAQYGTFSVDQFEQWNPAVGNGCGNLLAGDWYCVGVPGISTVKPTSTSAGPHSPQQTGITSDCTNWYKAQKGDSCYAISSKYGTFSVDQFEQWNPAVGSDCGKLLSGDWYCVGVPGTPTTRPSSTSEPYSPHQTGITANCNNWYEVASGDTCDSITQKYSISLDNFYSWNPAVGTDCHALWVDNYVCVGVN